MTDSKRLLLKFSHSICLVIVLLLVGKLLDLHAWWIVIIIMTVSWYLGSFLTVFIHGISVGELKHNRSDNLTYYFTVLIARGKRRNGFQGSYFRESPLTDLVLQARISNYLNKMPGSRDISAYLDNKKESEIFTMFIDDPGTIFGATEVRIIRIA